MKGYRFKLALLLLASTASLQCTLAADLPTTLPSVGLTGGITTNSPYANLQEAWDDCFNLRSTCTDLLDEGRYAPARKKWVDYDVSTMAQLITNLKAASSGPQFPANTSIEAMEKNLAKLQTIAADMKSPTDDKYPAAFWGPTRDMMNNAGDLDKALVQTLGTLEASATPQPTKLQGKASVTGKSSDVEGLATASKKITDVTLHMAAELDRFNLSWGPPPTQPLKNEFYQGAFTKQEILSQYKYMPSFVFTTDPSVAMFTYRLPPRKNMLAHYAVQIGKLLNLMDTDMQNVQAALNASDNEAVTGPWKEMEAKYIDARNQYMSLYNLLQSTTDEKLSADIRNDQLVYGKPIMAIRADMDSLRNAMNDLVAIGK